MQKRKKSRKYFLWGVSELLLARIFKILKRQFYYYVRFNFLINFCEKNTYVRNTYNFSPRKVFKNFPPPFQNS